MKIYCDGSSTKTCILPEGFEPCVIPFGGMTTNEAEYEALIRALEFALDQPPQHFEILTDSQLVVRQVWGYSKGGRWKYYAIKAGNLMTRAMEAWELITFIKNKESTVEIKHVPREENLAGQILG